MNTKNGMHIQTMNNIKQLQDLEKKLYSNLETVSQNDKQLSAQTDLIKQINDITQSRIGMFEQLKTIKNLLKSELSAEQESLKDNMDMISLVEGELNTAKKKLNLHKTENINTLRMTEIDTYFQKKYTAYASVIKSFIIFCIPIIIVIMLKKNQTITVQMTNILLAVIIVGCLIYNGLSLLDISNRDNMNFDEYRFSSSGGTNGPSLVEYDEQQIGYLNNSQEIKNMIGGDLQDLGQCIGSECCGKNMTYNKKKEICEPSSKKESFVSGQPAFLGAPYGVTETQQKLIIYEKENPNYYSYN